MPPLLRSGFCPYCRAPTHRSPGELLATAASGKVGNKGMGLSQMPKLSPVALGQLRDIVGGRVEGGGRRPDGACAGRSQTMGSALLSVGCLWAFSRRGEHLPVRWFLGECQALGPDLCRP